MPTKTKAKKDVYQAVTDRVIAALEEGTVPWQRPWQVVGGIHKNLNSKRAYRGINQMLLDMTSLLNNYTSPYWMSYKQAKVLGGQVRKGEVGTYVVFFKPIKIETDEIDKKTGKPKIKTIPLIRDYVVFNLEQVEGIDPKKIPAITSHEEFTPIQRAERVIKGMPNPPKMYHGGDVASYNVETDVIRMPARKQFHTAEGYYATDFHERVHSTRHSSRLDRYKAGNREGRAKEELVAELGSSMLCAIVGIDNDRQQDQTAAYIKSWLRALKDDKKLIVSAGSQAHRACEYILGEIKEEEKS